MSEEQDPDFRSFLDLHSGALTSAGVPPNLWRALHLKLSAQVYDAGEVFGIMQTEEEEEDEDEKEGGASEEEKKQQPGAGRSCKVMVTRETGLKVSDPTSIFLVDHAWTYRMEQAREQLQQVPGLASRMAALMGLEPKEQPELQEPHPHTVDQVMENMWRFNQTYQLSQGSAEEKVPVWYIMDEFGSQVQHSDRPSCAMAPFFYMKDQLAFTLLWPLHDLQQGDEVTRDFTYGEKNPLVRRCRLLPWRPSSRLEGVSSSTSEPPDSYYEAIFQENKEQLPVEVQEISVPKDQVLKVYCEMSQVRENLTHPQFELTEQEDEAHIIWGYNHIKDYRKLSEERPHVLLNQFPCENLVTVKDCLAAVSRRVNAGTGPDWIPETFNLQTELPQFIKRFRQREESAEDNHWICKPWNLARGLDTHVTNNLHYIIRQRESTPKVVCKYIEDPVLFLRPEVGLVKFDIRYMLLLRSVRPLRLYAYHVFWLRFANRPFSLSHFDDYQKHFTVMNYDPAAPLKQVHYDDFILEFERQYPQHPWKEVQGELFKAFRELFQAAASRPAPYGIGHYPSSRAIYAVDLMLKWTTDQTGERVMCPQILEVNFSPDCGRACQYHPNFYNHMFQTLFLDQSHCCPVSPII